MQFASYIYNKDMEKFQTIYNFVVDTYKNAIQDVLFLIIR